MILKRRVGPNRRDFGDEAEARAGYEGQDVVSGLHGWYHEACLNGNMFVASGAAAGLALLVAHATNGNPTLWNPAGSDVYLEIIALELTYVGVLHCAPGSLYWYITNPAGSNIAATGSPIIVFTNSAPVNCLLGSEKTSKAKWSCVAGDPDFAAAPSLLCNAGFSLATMEDASVPAPFTMLRIYDGSLIIPPGVALTLGSSAATTTATFIPSIFYIETKMPKMLN